MMETDLRQGIEALLFVAEEPIPLETLAEMLERDAADVRVALTELAGEYEADQRGIAIREVGGGWRAYTAPAAYPVVERYALAGRTGRLTQAALETLAVVAYKQPISRQEISDIRGVNADGAVRSLVQRGFLDEVGRDDGPGQAILYGTTGLLLERLGMGSLDDLPPLAEHLPEAPAPDEPPIDQFREARKLLAAGEELPTRSPLGDRDTNTGDEPMVDVKERDDEPTLPPVQVRTERREDREEMDALTDALERAARSAMGALRAAVEVADRDDEASDGPPQPEGDSTTTDGGVAAPIRSEDEDG